MAGTKGHTGCCLAIVLALGAGLRLCHLTDRSIWFDEAFSWRMIQYPLGEMLHRIALDNSPPLYFVLLKYWSACFGDSLLALRSLSVVAGVASILAMFLFVRAASSAAERADGSAPPARSDRAAPALFAALLVAISVLQIRWSWDVRPYALGGALALLSSWALFRALRPGEGAQRWWYGYAALAVLFAYTHYFALFGVAAQGGYVLYVLLRAGGRSIRETLRAPAARRAALAFGLIALCGLPWLPFFLRQLSQVRAEFWIRPFQPWNLAHLVYQMFVEPENAALTRTASLWALDLCVLAWVALLWRPRQEAVYVAAGALAPIGLSILLSRLGVQVFLLRYLLFAHLFFLAGLAMLVYHRIPFTMERRLVAAMVAAWGLFACYEFYEKADFRNRPGTRAAAEWIAREAGPDEPVVVTSAFAYLPVLYHLRGRGHCWLYQDRGATPHYLGTAVLRPEDIMDTRAVRASPSRRIWLVDSTIGVGGARELPEMAPRQAGEQHVFAEVFGLGETIVQQYVEPARQGDRQPKLRLDAIADLELGRR